MTPSREIDARIAVEFFGAKGVGYYGPTKTHGYHLDYQLCATKEEAMALYEQHWGPNRGKQGYAGPPDDLEMSQWKDGWGPLVIDEYTDDLYAAWDLLAFVPDPMRLVREGKWRLEAGDRRGPDEDSAPLAICAAVLAWKEATVPDDRDWPEQRARLKASLRTSDKAPLTRLLHSIVVADDLRAALARVDHLEHSLHLENLAHGEASVRAERAEARVKELEAERDALARAEKAEAEAAALKSALEVAKDAYYGSM